MMWFNVLIARRSLVGCVFVVLFLSQSFEAQSQERRGYRLGTASTSELPHAIGVTLAALIKLKLLPTTGIDINAQNTAGSIDNARLLQDGSVDFGILTSLDAHDLVMRTAIESAEANGVEADSGVRMLASLWTEGVHVIARQDLVPSGNFADFLQLRNLRVSLGERESSDFRHGLALFDAFDIDVEQVHKIADLGRDGARAAFLNGDLDAFLFTSTLSDNDVLAFLEEAGPAVVPLNFDEGMLMKANKRGSKAWTMVQMATGKPEPHQTLGVTYQLAVAAGVVDGVVYRMTKTIFDNLPVLNGMHAATKGISLPEGIQQVIVPIHPGAARYYQEIELEVPEPASVRISNLSSAGFLKRFTTNQSARLELTNNNISIIGGQEGQTIGRITSELASILRDDGLRLLSMQSPDPANNIAQVLYAKGVDGAFIPVDILNYAVDQQVYPGLRSKLVYTSELYDQEFHVLAAPDIDTIADLVGRPVNLGVKDSGAEFTASFLFDGLNISIEPTYFKSREALARLRRGELAAVVILEGKPVPLLKESGVADGLRFLSVPPLEGVAYRPAVIDASDYPFILQAGEEIETFSVRTALMTYNWRPENPRYTALSTFVDRFFSKLSSMQREGGGLHPKWLDIDPFAEIEGWQRFPGAQQWLNGRTSSSTPGAN